MSNRVAAMRVTCKLVVCLLVAGCLSSALAQERHDVFISVDIDITLSFGPIRFEETREEYIATEMAKAWKKELHHWNVKWGSRPDQHPRLELTITRGENSGLWLIPRLLKSDGSEASGLPPKKKFYAGPLPPTSEGWWRIVKGYFDADDKKVTRQIQDVLRNFIPIAANVELVRSQGEVAARVEVAAWFDQIKLSEFRVCCKEPETAEQVTLYHEGVAKSDVDNKFDLKLTRCCSAICTAECSGQREPPPEITDWKSCYLLLKDLVDTRTDGIIVPTE